VDLSGLDFLHPAVLLLLPLAALPLWRRRADAVPFSYLPWLPVDPWGQALQWLWRSLAALSIAAVVVALAGPGQPAASVTRTGRGAEILILFDRSSSMDARVILRNMNRSPDSKNVVARRLLSEFVSQRQDDRFALTMFSTRPMTIVPFTERRDSVLAGLAAAGITRGLPETDMGAALLEAIAQFAPRPYSGSRIVLVVSDGGAQLDDATRRRIAAGLVRHRIGINWIYLRSTPLSPDLLALGDRPGDGASEEAALHEFFRGVGTPYRLYQTDDAEALSKAIADVARQQNQLLTFSERVPRRDRTGALLVVALSAARG
jgi:mxaC protein